MTLKMSWEYDHASGLFEVTLENGTRFKVNRQDVNGKLENALTLYRRAVVAFLEDKPIRKSSKTKERQDIMELSAGRNVQVIAVRSRKKERPVNLNDLEVDID